MSTNYEFSQSALSWVKKELEESLRDASLALEAFAENIEDITQLRFYLNHLHQVEGVLEMVELAGANLLAAETKALALGILEKRIEADTQALEALMQGTLSLQDYLNRLNSGKKDHPISVLPIVNEIRQTYNQTPLKKIDFFDPELNTLLPDTLTSYLLEMDGDIPSLFSSKLRLQYESALLSWFRNSANDSLLRLAEVISELRKNCRDVAAIRLWWLSQGVIEALQENGIQSTQEIKLLLGELNKKIKILIQSGEPALVADITDHLLKSLLLQIANATSSGSYVTAIKTTYQLENYAPSDQSSLNNLGTEVINTVLDAFHEDLAQVKDSLDIFDRTNTQPQKIENLSYLLHKMVDTLAIIGFNTPISILHEAIIQMEETSQNEAEFDRNKQLELADSLLKVEASLQTEIALSRNPKKGSSTAHHHFNIHQAAPLDRDPESNSNVESALHTATKECLDELSIVSGALTSYSLNLNDPNILDPVPNKLQQISETLSVLGLTRIADLITECNLCINKTLIGKSYNTSPTNLEALAEAICAIELYLEMLTEGALASGSLLDTAADCLTRISESVDNTADEHPATVESVDAIPVSEEPASEITEASSSPGIKSDSVPSHQTIWEIPSTPVYPEGVDPEIATYFIEEAQEEMLSIAKHFSQWRQDSNQQEALKTIRRSFHTLKGSGRLVGATDIGELAWAIENMLNRIMEGAIEIKPAVFEIIEGAQQALSQLLTLFTQGGGKPAESILALSHRAQAVADSMPNLTSGEDDPILQATDIENSCAPSAKNSEPSTGEKISEHDPESTQKAQLAKQETFISDQHTSSASGYLSDPELLAVFLDEADDILQAIETTLTDLRASPQESTPVQQLQRELHTLKGGARLANLTALGDLSHDLESLITVAIDKGATDNNEFLCLLQEGHDRLAEMCDSLRHGAALLAANDVSSRIHGMADSLPCTEKTPPTPDVLSPDDAPDPGLIKDLPIDPNNELVAAFLEEADELLQASQISLSAWQENPSSEQVPAEEFQRHLHTLKGGARLAGVTLLADLTHHMETVASAVTEGKRNAEPELFGLLQHCLDRLCTLCEFAQNAAPLPSISDLLIEISRYSSEDLPSSQNSEQARLIHNQELPAALAIPPEQELHKTTHPLTETGTSPVEQVRVRADLLDHLVNNAAEVNIFSTRIEQQIGTIRLNLGEMERTVARLRSQIRRLEIETEAQIIYRHEEKNNQHLEGFDPLEMDRYSQLHQLSRGLVESISDLTNIKETLDETAREADILLLQQSRTGADLQQGLMNTRMLPFTGVTPRLHRIVRQTAQELDKKVQIKITDSGHELDRTVLNRIIAPLEHMLRNSIAHGIESPPLRIAAGKKEMGSISLSLIREGSEIVIHVSDDGQGIDLEKIRAKALTRGLVQKEAMPPDDDLIQLILESGFSTADNISQVAGRGIGMDVVNSEIRALNGTLAITSQKGKGTTFTIRLPLTLTIVQALLVETNNELFALPIISVQSVIRLDKETIDSLLASEQRLFSHEDVNYRFIHLGAALGQDYPETSSSSSNTHYPVLLVRSGEFQAAILVDTLIGSREIVIKSVGPQLGAIKEIAGATILGDGRVVLILDLPALIRKIAQKTETSISIRQQTATKIAQKPIVMVIDDSITIRKTTEKILQRHGMEVLTARDGVNAVELLQESIPDIFLLDIEMPRMDGFELATFIRKDERLQDIPIIMITSRSGKKHRDRANQIGVNTYLIKPYQEDELLQHIQLFLNTTEANVTF
ncbi:Hpt domain-containing protein [Nitrosococcus watsonii]|uniref:Chemotaxis protein CheA n=1 Tax=Nitrosococcus watsoni (strain C-113) TaxID=105559 RepID=D8K898_NITWC|nr:Hpt domain-containing protein [Nitrosococcus watsonii]ADJ27093.1 CheA signal transduction histidine kinase [Nitrosococcus watsonii C-113]